MCVVSSARSPSRNVEKAIVTRSQITIHRHQAKRWGRLGAKAQWLYETINKPRGVSHNGTGVYLCSLTYTITSLLLYRPRDHHTPPTYRQPEYPGVILLFQPQGTRNSSKKAQPAVPVVTPPPLLAQGWRKRTLDDPRHERCL